MERLIDLIRYLLDRLLQRTSVFGLGIAAMIFGLPTAIIIGFTNLWPMAVAAKMSWTLLGWFLFAVGFGAVIAPATILEDLRDAQKLRRKELLSDDEYKEVRLDILRKVNRPGLLRFLRWGKNHLAEEWDPCLSRMRDLLDDYSPPDPDPGDGPPVQE